MQEVKTLQFEKYFESSIPIGMTGAPKHSYEITIERAVFT
jgi:hypothetical protein